MNREAILVMMKVIESNADDVDDGEGLYSLHWDDFYDVGINGQIIPVSSLILTDSSVDCYGAMGFKRFELLEIIEMEL